MPRWLFSLLLSTNAFAQEGAGGLFGFFDGKDIDYWQEGRMVKDPLSLVIVNQQKPMPVAQDRHPHTDILPGANVLRATDVQPFSWNRYEDPRQAEFWDDGGDWIPPRPFREAASNPSPENIRRYLAWQQRKAIVTQSFQKALVHADETRAAQRAPIPWSKLQITYFYQSACSHCQASQAFVEDLRKRGISMTFVQLDYGQNPPLHKPSVPYDPRLDWQRPIQATPTWVLKLGSKTLTHTGELSLKTLFDMASSLIKKEERS